VFFAVFARDALDRLTWSDVQRIQFIDFGGGQSSRGRKEDRSGDRSRTRLREDRAAGGR
jgi:hypothetical protein